jgi:hypothetical protein
MLKWTKTIRCTFRNDFRSACVGISVTNAHIITVATIHMFTHSHKALKPTLHAKHSTNK